MGIDECHEALKGSITGSVYKRFLAKKRALWKERTAVRRLIDAFNSNADGQALVRRVTRLKSDASELLASILQAKKRPSSKPTADQAMVEELRRKGGRVMRKVAYSYRHKQQTLKATIYHVKPSGVGRSGTNPNVKCWDGYYGSGQYTTFKA